MRKLFDYEKLRVRLLYRIDRWLFSYRLPPDVDPDDILQLTGRLREAMDRRRHRLGFDSDPHGTLNGIELAIAYSELVVKSWFRLTDRELHWFYGGYHLDFLIGDQDEEIAVHFESLKTIMKIPPPYWQRNHFGLLYPS